MDEYQNHRQCQTCFKSFPSSATLHQHFEDFRSREKLLLAELERCRMHIAASENGNENVECAGGCPSFNHKFGEIRHLEQHVPCNETCPSCFNVFSFVRPFMRHDCKIPRSEPATIYLQERTASLTRSVHSHLDKKYARPNKRRRIDPASGNLDGSPTPACSIPTTAPVDQFANAFNTTGNALRFEPIPNLGAIPTVSQFGEPRHGEVSSLAVDGEYAFASVGGDSLSLVDTANTGEWAYADLQFPIN